jgi:hypothetical protein
MWGKIGSNINLSAIIHLTVVYFMSISEEAFVLSWSTPELGNLLVTPTPLECFLAVFFDPFAFFLFQSLLRSILVAYGL